MSRPSTSETPPALRLVRSTPASVVPDVRRRGSLRAYRRRLRLLRVAAPPGLRARLRRELVAYSLVIGSTARR